MRHGAELEYLRALYRERGLTDEEIDERFREANKRSFLWSIVAIIAGIIGFIIFIGVN